MQALKIEANNGTSAENCYSDYPSYKKCDSPKKFLDLLSVGEEEHCRWLFTPKSLEPNKWHFIGDASKSKTSLKKSEKYKSTLIDVKSNTRSNDVFFSPSEFFYWRNSDQLAKLKANWIDIDTIDHKKLSDQDGSILFQKVIAALEEAKIPAPTGYVLSGFGGIHFYWIYDAKLDAYKNKVIRWKLLTQAIINLLATKLTTDICTIDSSCSLDPTRVLRMPGSIRIIREPSRAKKPKQKKEESTEDFNKRKNSYAASIASFPDRKAEYEYITKEGVSKLGNISGAKYKIIHAFIGGPLYSFESLANALNVSSKITKKDAVNNKNNVIYLEHKKTNKKKPTEVKKKNSGKHKIEQWWFKNYMHISTHARKNGVKNGQRDLYVFILFVCLQHIKKSNDLAYSEIKKINADIIGLSEIELERYLSTAMHGKDPNRIGPKYRFSKKGMAKYLAQLDIDKSYLFQNDKLTLCSEEVTHRQSAGAIKAARNKREKTTATINSAIATLSQSGTKVTQAAVAKESGFSIATVKRHFATLR